MSSKSEDVSGPKDQVDGVEGSDSRRHTRVLEWIRTRSPRFVRWIVLLFIASLAIPALTKQWSDRRQELGLKETLLTGISAISADAVYGAQETASQQPGASQSSKRNETWQKWLRDRATVDPQFRVYFSGSDAADHWFENGPKPGFRDAVLMYVLLACCDAGARSPQVDALHRYLGDPPTPKDLEDPWSVLSCGPQEGCPPHYARAYVWLGSNVLYQRRVLLDQLLDANAAGYSSGWRDFIGDLNPLG